MSAWIELRSNCWQPEHVSSRAPARVCSWGRKSALTPPGGIGGAIRGRRRLLDPWDSSTQASPSAGKLKDCGSFARYGSLDLGSSVGLPLEKVEELNFSDASILLAQSASATMAMTGNLTNQKAASVMGRSRPNTRLMNQLSQAMQRREVLIASRQSEPSALGRLLIQRTNSSSVLASSD
jgi:hypothetical protein